ncbi:MAG: FecR family protein [Spirochaetes bacterium]|nr:FecR family protein [Spirochaetota bacterium]
MRKKILVFSLCAIIGSLVACPRKLSDDTARIHFLIGNVDVFSQGKKIIPIVGGILISQDEIKTAAKSSCDLLFYESLLVRIGENTKALVGKLAHEARTVLEISKGRAVGVFTRLGKGTNIRVKGTTVTIAVRGTVFSLECDEKSTTVSVLRGEAEMEIVGDVGVKKFAMHSDTIATVHKDIMEDLLSDKKVPAMRKLTDAEKAKIIDELISIQQQSIQLLSPELKEAANDEIIAILKEESESQKRKRERNAAMRKAAEEARKKAELEEALRKKEEEEKRKMEEERRLREEEMRKEEEKRKKEAEEAEKKKREARKAAIKKQQLQQKTDRSADTSGN